ncbi:hypothetical protein BKP45_05025 [Anaerobacillus alkalidiazotrophicus]|uniref:Uncharacterized protein n=1 Tax=Anaerobacillus alkalidiazotrophicus TaxID=472963 RepID=A0A1S2MBA1_9BACI|nr:hypothetical protein [Anaerobacillus alkalidiazotrophicus]OIJ22042.1 hypothetical protein BKP45_05025 [Anaerobacillus alkalidiazotrophicus]
MESVEKSIEEKWFKEHKATLTQHGDLQILEWKRPGTNTYYCRYVFDGYKMYISGDIGEAVFWLTWKSNVHSFDDIGVHYFEEKLAAYSEERRDYDGDKAAKRLSEWKKELIEEEVIFDHEEFDEMILAAINCSNKNEWAYECVNDLYSELITELDHDYWEWIYNIGDMMPHRIIGYLVGLKMASKQLKENETVTA